MDPEVEEDREIRQNLIRMNKMLDDIIRDANIPVPDIQDVDLTICNDFQKMSEMLLGKLSVIEACCDTAAVSTDKKYDPKIIRDKIALKKKQLAELESENATLTEIARKQEKQIEQMNANDDNSNEQQQHVLKLRKELKDAQAEIKELEEQRTQLINENKRKKGEITRGEKVAQGGPLSQQQIALKEKESDMEAKKERERKIYEKKMESLRKEKENLSRKKAELEEEIKRKEDELRAIHEKNPRPTGFQRHKK